MSKRPTASEIGTSRIESAAIASRPWKPPRGTNDEVRSHLLLAIHQARVVPLPEPVEVPPMVNGRRLEPWEAGLYVEWAHRERRAELALLAGIGPL